MRNQLMVTTAQPSSIYVRQRTQPPLTLRCDCEGATSVAVQPAYMIAIAEFTLVYFHSCGLLDGGYVTERYRIV
jgi:hypothetical protein